ncbi:MAG: 4Fe-4S ferredoxin [Marinilabiliales bacterium]|nr:MAG: 4Fe-4S ferredoxin [Marinilabiliales bacterium]
MQKSKKSTRREFFKKLSVGVGGSVVALSACTGPEFDNFFQKNFKTLSKEEIDNILLDLEKKYTEQYGKEFKVSGKKAIDNTFFGYALDLSRCVGCRRCVYGCVDENNQSRDPQIHWITVLQMEKEKGIDYMHSNMYYNPEKVPEEGKFYVPIACQQCANPPCTKVCPAKATWTEPDGITVIDYNWCIGCRYCQSACPYGARHFNWGEPKITNEEINTNTHYLGNRPRTKGVVEKCTFCIQRVREGKYPSCVEVCPTGSRKFGNLLDPNSEIRYILENKRVVVLKAELNTQPNFFYFFGV